MFDSLSPIRLNSVIAAYIQLAPLEEVGSAPVHLDVANGMHLCDS